MELKDQGKDAATWDADENLLPTTYHNKRLADYVPAGFPGPGAEPVVVCAHAVASYCTLQLADETGVAKVFGGRGTDHEVPGVSLMGTVAAGRGDRDYHAIPVSCPRLPAAMLHRHKPIVVWSGELW